MSRPSNDPSADNPSSPGETDPLAAPSAGAVPSEPTDRLDPVEPVAPSQPEHMRIRKAPKIPIFLIGGAALGALLAIILEFTQEPNPDYAEGSSLGFFIALLAVPGLALGALVWLFLDRRSKKRSYDVYAESVDRPEEAEFALEQAQLHELEDRWDNDEHAR